MEEVIEQTFPTAKIQRCRNIAAKVRVTDRKEILDDFKEVYNASKLEEALSNLETFTSKWKRKYPRVIDILDKNTYLLTYFDYPKEVRHSIYSTNLIEGFNKQLKKKWKVSIAAMIRPKHQWKNT